MTYRSLYINYIFLIDINYFDYYVSNICFSNNFKNILSKHYLINNFNRFVFYYLNNLLFYYSLYLKKQIDFQYFLAKNTHRSFKNNITKENIKLEHTSLTEKKLSKIALLAEKKVIFAYQISSNHILNLRSRNVINNLSYFSFLQIKNNGVFFKNSTIFVQAFFKKILVKPYSFLDHQFNIISNIPGKKSHFFKNFFFYFI